MPPAWGWSFLIEYRVDGQLRNETRFIRRFPHYFRIAVADVPEEVRTNYDQDFNQGRLQMVAMDMRLRPLEGGPATAVPLLRRQGKMTRFPCERIRSTSGPPWPPLPGVTRTRPISPAGNRPMPGAQMFREMSGFFPQGDEVRNDDRAMQVLLRDLRTAGVERRWTAAEDPSPIPRPSMSSWRNCPRPTPT